MSCCRPVARPLARRLPRARPFSAAAARLADAAQPPPPPPQPSALDLDPDTVLPEFELPLMRAGKMPVGSRRRRVAMRAPGGLGLAFEQLPYQAFQEARAVLAADRADKVASLRTALVKTARLRALDAADVPGGRCMQETRLASLRRQVERLKILADANDPLVKKRFEDGLGDMNKPIYRHYARRKWRAYDARVVAQRIRQFHIVPDLLPRLEPEADVQLFFGRARIAPGAVVGSAVSDRAPRLRVQVFDAGERLVTVAVVDADVPDVAADAFAKRCHFLATNVPLGPARSSLPLGRLRAADQLVRPWLPPFAQKGSPYHRLAVVVLEQPPGAPLDAARMRALYAAAPPADASPADAALAPAAPAGASFSLKSLRDKFSLRPVGFTMFRSVWDEATAGVMARHGLPGADVELRPVRVRSLKPPVRPRGWEARRQGPKFRHLWKYTKRIRGISNARGWIKKR